MINYGRQSIDEEDINAVINTLKSDWLTQGPSVNAFEEGLLDYCGSQYAVAVSNGTAALHLACIALEVGKNSNVWTTANTFVASANCAKYLNAKVDFVDIDLGTGNMCLNAFEEKIQSSESSLRPNVVVAVHFSGNPLDMERLYHLSKQYEFKIIEDASHAIGASYTNGKKVGCCCYSEITVFSFHPVKVITTAEGGALLTNKDELNKSVRLHASHGITKENSDFPWEYDQVCLGYNYRMSDIQASLGYSQLKKLNTFVSKRRDISEYYLKSISNPKLSFVNQDQYGKSSYHLIQIKSDNQKELFYYLLEKGIRPQVHYIPVVQHSYYSKLGFKIEDYPNAQAFYQSVLSIPIYPDLTAQEINLVCEALNLYGK